MPKKTCSKCQEPSLPSLNKPLCQYHYAERQWGTAWAKHATNSHGHDPRSCQQCIINSQPVTP